MPMPIGLNYNNSILYASENQDKLYTGSSYLINGLSLQKIQSTFLLPTSINIQQYSLAIGEISYDYISGVQDTNNPIFRI